MGNGIKTLKDRIYSKVRKVILPQESYSIIGIDYNSELCCWPIEIAKNYYPQINDREISEYTSVNPSPPEKFSIVEIQY